MTTQPIVVTGANGNVGRPLVDHLVARDVPVRAAVHAPHEQMDFEPPVEVVQFDFTDPSTWRAAFEGARGMFVLRPPALSKVERDVNPAINAAVEAGVEHIVTLSVMGAGDNAFLPHRRIEQHVEQLGVRWTHLRPGFFMQNLNGPHRRGIVEHDEIIVPAGDGKANFVDTRDVAEVAAVVLAEGEPHFETVYEPTGPEAMGYARVAAIMSDQLGREIRYNRPGYLRYLRHMRREVGYPWGFVLVSAILHSVVRLGRSERITDDVQRVVGRQPYSVREFVADHVDVWEK